MSVEQYQKEIQSLELLIKGFQKENEKLTLENKKLKKANIEEQKCE